MCLGRWVSVAGLAGAEKAERVFGSEGYGIIREQDADGHGMGWEWTATATATTTVGAGCSSAVTLLARCEVLLARHGIRTQLPTTSQTQAALRVQQTLFRTRHAATVPAPTSKRCESVRFFHGRTAARRQMGKWAR
jgi:hypothetical protein